MDKDEEGDEAELLPRFDLLGEAPSDGDAAAGAARSQPWLRVRVSGDRKSEGEREGRVSVGFSSTVEARQRVGASWCGSDEPARLDRYRRKKKATFQGAPCL